MIGFSSCIKAGGRSTCTAAAATGSQCRRFQSTIGKTTITAHRCSCTEVLGAHEACVESRWIYVCVANLVNICSPPSPWRRRYPNRMEIRHTVQSILIIPVFFVIAAQVVCSQYSAAPRTFKKKKYERCLDILYRGSSNWQYLYYQ